MADKSQFGKNQPKSYCGKPGRSGPAKANLNATKNGTGISRLTLGELPSTMRRQLQNARKYRRQLETIVADVHGGINTTQAHLIDEATGAEVHASVCRWLLRTKLKDMSVSDIARCSEQVMKARAVRNRAVERLQLDLDPTATAIDALYTVVEPDVTDDKGDTNEPT